MKRVSAMLLLCLVAACNNKENDQMQKQALSHDYQLNANEQKVFDTLIQQDIKIFGRGGDSMLQAELEKTRGLIRTTSQDAARTYEANQGAGDQKYFKKTIVLSGRVREVRRDGENKPYLTLEGGNPLTLPQVHFKNKAPLDRVTKISKGEKVYFVCIGGGTMAGTVRFEECEFADNYAEVAMAEMLKNKASLDAKKLSAVIVASLLKPDSSCFVEPPNQQNCAAEISHIGESKTEAAEAAFKQAIVDARKKTGIGADTHKK